MQIQRDKALQILSVLGFESMVKQPNKVLAKRLLNIDSYITPDTVFVGEDLDLVDEMSLAEDITVLGNMVTPAPRRKKKKLTPENTPPSDAPIPTPPSTNPTSSPSNATGTPSSGPSKRRGRQVGIGATIIEALKTGHYTKKEIHMILQLKFPERSARAMKNTVDSAVPTGLRKEKGLEILKDNENKYYIEKE